jgi:3',5'-cyclic AMP phosphodiesterase CpdA
MMDQDARGNRPVDRLLHITDIHFWEIVINPLRLMGKRALGNLNVFLRRRHEYITERAEEYAQWLAETGVTTLFAGGDFTSTATDAEYKMALEFLHRLRSHGFDIIILPGNHDVYTFASGRNRRFQKHFADFLHHDGELPCRIDLPGGTPMVLTPTVRPNLISSRGFISLPEIDETVRLVKEAPPGPVLIGAHYPVIEKTTAWASSWSRRLHNAHLFRRALGETGRRVLYIAGHVHHFSYHRDPDFPDLRQVTTSAFFMQRRGHTRRGAFTEIHVMPDAFGIIQHWYEDGPHHKAASCESF